MIVRALKLPPKCELKEQILAKVGTCKGKYRRFRAEDALLAFLKSL